MQPLYPACSIHSTGSEVQPIQASPCRPGLAALAVNGFGATSAFQTCYFPPFLSVRGRSGDPWVICIQPTPSDSEIHQAVKRRTEGL
jgi:hypothetical protein